MQFCIIMQTRGATPEKSSIKTHRHRNVFYLWCWKRSGSSGLWWGLWSFCASWCDNVFVYYCLAAGCWVAECLWQSPNQSRHSPGSPEDPSCYPTRLVLVNINTERETKWDVSTQMKMGHVVRLQYICSLTILTNRKPIFVVIVVLQAVTLWQDLQFAGDIITATNVGEL